MRMFYRGFSIGYNEGLMEILLYILASRNFLNGTCIYNSIGEISEQYKKNNLTIYSLVIVGLVQLTTLLLDYLSSAKYSVI